MCSTCVRLVPLGIHSLTAPFQTELTTHTYVAVESVSQKLDGLAIQVESTRCQDPSVSATSSPRGTNADHHADSGQVSSTEYYLAHSLTFPQCPSWRIASPSAKGLLRAKRPDRGDRWACRKTQTYRSDWRRRDWENIHCPHRPSKRSHQAPFLRQPQVHSLRQVLGFACQFPRTTLQDHRFRRQKS